MVGGDRIDDELNKTSPAPTRRFIRCKTDRARSRWRGITCCVFIRIRGCNTVPSRYALAQLYRVGAHAELISSMLLLHVAQYQLDRLRSRLQWDDGFRHMASMPGVRC